MTAYVMTRDWHIRMMKIWNVLFPIPYNKKAVAALSSKDIDDDDSFNCYTVCAKDGGDLGDTVSYVNCFTLGRMLSTDECISI